MVPADLLPFTQGEKIFYLIKPTSTNLALYEEWSLSPNQSEVFFGEKVDKCYKCVVRPGTTLLIPTGTAPVSHLPRCSYSLHNVRRSLTLLINSHLEHRHRDRLQWPKCPTENFELTGSLV